jgi:TonB family protein
MRYLALLLILAAGGKAVPAHAQDCIPAKQTIARMPTRPPEHLRGTTRLLVTVARDGTVLDAKIAISSRIPEIDAFALEYARTAWRYVLPGNICLAGPITTPVVVIF